MTLQQALKHKFNIVKGMNEIVKAMNDEDAYMKWVEVVPDEATDEDLQEIAEDDDLFRYTVKTFNNLNCLYGDDLYLN